MKNSLNKKILSLIKIILVTSIVISAAFSQGKTKWMAVGSLHSWYSEFGCEIEEGLFASQQFGLRWPADHNYMDMQAAKSFWIGVKDFTDAAQFGGSSYPNKVVHIGPRVKGTNEFFPMQWKMISKFTNPTVSVDGNESFQLAAENDKIDPNLPYDRLIYNVVNTQLGATVTRKIYQFGQEYHNNYIVHEITVKNTGNVDDDPEIELPSTTLKDLYLFYQYRLAVSRNTRYLIGNSSGWGINTMCDVRGDGLGTKYGTKDEDIRANFAWHGKYPAFTLYDNLGGPIWAPVTTGGLLSPTDTVGRLGSAQFVGVVTLHADKNSKDNSDDKTQPSTTTYINSDATFNSNNDPFNPTKMTQEYELMSAGHSVRHAWVVEPAGKFTEPKSDPSLGTSGGHSNANGYGPYTLAPGDSIKIVFAEAASGLSWKQSIEIGKQFKKGQINAVKKNEYVMSGYDSLMQTFRRAMTNFNGGKGFTLPEAPFPPNAFNINSGGDRVQLSWEHNGKGPKVTGYEIYRAKGSWDSTYTKIHTAAPNEFTFDDITLARGVDYYYYIVAVGDPADNTGGGMTPKGVALKSSKFYTQSFDPANLKRPAGKNLSDFRIVPNPYVISADPNNMLFPSRKNRLAFFDVPAKCNIKIYTELGELIYEINHTDGSGDEFWDLNTSSNQLVVSGIYIAVVTDLNTGKNEIQKFVVIR